MRYSAKEEDTLCLALIRSLDADPPWDPARLTFRGQVVPYVERIEIRWKPGNAPIAVLHATPRAARGHAKDDPTWHALMREIRASGVTIVGWPEPGEDEQAASPASASTTSPTEEKAL